MNGLPACPAELLADWGGALCSRWRFEIAAVQTIFELAVWNVALLETHVAAEQLVQVKPLTSKT